MGYYYNHHSETNQCDDAGAAAAVGQVSWVTLCETFLLSPTLATLLPFMTIRHLGITPVTTALDPYMFLAILSLAYSVYAFDRVKDVCTNVEDKINRGDLTCFIQRHQLKVWMSAILSMLILGYSSTHLSMASQAIIALGATLGFGYTVPFLPAGHSLRTAPACKTLTVVVCFCLVGVLLPLAAAGTFWNANWLHVVAMVGHVTLLCHESVFSDMREILGDAESGTLSIPVLFGKEATLKSMRAFCVVEGIFKFLVLRSPWLILSNLIFFGRESKIGSSGYFEHPRFPACSILLCVLTSLL